jgi:protein-S-isoprenylcysteine O-methyltransferase Ste14
LDFRFVSPFLMWGIVFVGAAAALLFAPGIELLPKNILGLALFALSFLNWLYFFVSALLANREAAKSASGISKIVDFGVYGIVRHPIYFADILFAWGVFLLLPSSKVFLAALWLTVVMVYWSKLEERALLAKFGKEYSEYMKKVPGLFPKLK